MRLFPAGSIPWLLLHELRLTWRGRRRNKGTARWLLPMLALCGLAGLTLGGFGLAKILSSVPVGLGPELAAVTDGVVALLFTFMLSQTLSATAIAFYERGDLDLLLSSPLPPRRLLMVRCLGIAANAAALYLVLAAPLFLPTVILVEPLWLNVFPLLISLSFFATACGLALALFMFAVLGPRRTRAFAQVLSALIGAAFYLGSQTWRFFGDGTNNMFVDTFQRLLKSGVFDPAGPAGLPARALLGEPVAASTIYVAAVLAFTLAVSSLSGRFVKNAAAAAGTAAGGVRASAKAARGFRGGPFGAMLRKDLRLIRRDIALLSQVLMRVLYLIPVAFVMLRNASGGGYLLPIMVAAMVFVTSQIAGSLAWIASSGEEGLELIACSPAPAPALRRAKLMASLIPVAWLVALPLAGLTWLSPWAGVATTLACVGASVSSGLIAIWHEKPAKRSDFRRRRSGSMLVGFAAFAIELCWAGAASIAVGPVWIAWAAFAPVCIALLGLLALRKPARSYAEVLQSV